MSQIISAARMENLERLVQFVSGHAESAGFPIQRIKEIELAAEEALVNIFNYAYPRMEGNVTIHCRVDDATRLVLEISDQGVPFNVLQVPDPDLSADISDRQVGGLGVFFVKEMADEASHRWVKDGNVLTLIFGKHRRHEERETQQKPEARL